MEEKKTDTGDVWQKLETVDSTDNWVEVKAADGTVLRLSKPGSGTGPKGAWSWKNEGFLDCESFEGCSEEDKPKRKVIVAGAPQPYDEFNFPRNVMESRMQMTPSLHQTGMPPPPPGGSIRAIFWEEASQTLYNVAFWPPSPQ